MFHHYLNSLFLASALRTIMEAAVGTQELSTFVTAIKAAEMEIILQNEGTFTVFAPNNDAFDQLPNKDDLLKPEKVSELKVILSRHIGLETVKTTDIKEAKRKLKTKGEEEIEITKEDEKFSIQSSAGNALVVSPNIQASNGVLHIVNAVLVVKS